MARDSDDKPTMTNWERTWNLKVMALLIFVDLMLKHRDDHDPLEWTFAEKEDVICTLPKIICDRFCVNHIQRLVGRCPKKWNQLSTVPRWPLEYAVLCCFW